MKLLLLFISIINLNMLHGAAVENCYEEFTMVFQSATEISFGRTNDFYCNLAVSFIETVPVGSDLYSISWSDDLVKPPYVSNTSNANTALEYIEYNTNNNEKIMSFSVLNSMAGLMDYDNSQEETVLSLQLYFPISANETYFLGIEHRLVDANTAVPTFEKNLYNFSIIETFPIGMTITGLLISAWDYDHLAPNNQFEVRVNGDCPLKSDPTYTSLQGLPVNVSFALKEKLDYDTMNEPYQITCTIYLEDKGISPLRSAPAIITLTVEPYPDENPVFSTDFYTGTLEDTSVNSVISVSPEILATSIDVPPTTEVYYEMTSVDNVPDASYYFSINSTTGIITVIKKVDETFQSWGSVSFIVMACDEYKLCGKALLTINMPLQESNELSFDASVYNVEILVENEGRQFTVHAESSSGNPVEYNFIKNNSTGLGHFEIGKTTGIISETTRASPGLYTFIVSADDGTATAISTVNINIIDTLKDGSIIAESIVSLSVEENYRGPIYEINIEGEFTYCVVSTSPHYYYYSPFTVNSTGVVSLANALDAEIARTVLVKIRIYEGFSYSECSTDSSFSAFTRSNEILLNVTVIDVNEYEPFFINNRGTDFAYEPIRISYPAIIQLQKCMPILNNNQFLYLGDSDITNNYTFSLAYESSPKVFEVDSETGDIYNLIEGQANADFKYVVEDPPFRTELRVLVEELSLDYIFTIKLESIKLDEIEEQLNTISSETNIYLILVYWSLVEGSSTGMSEVWDVNAHVYAKEHNLYRSLTIDDLNSYLQTSKYSSLVAQPFTDAVYFLQPEEGESYKTATIALGCVLGFVICLLVLIYVYQSFYRSKSKKKYGTVNTLGQAYANENFKGDSESNERVENMETAFGDTSSSQKADENSSEKSNLPKSEGKDIENLNSLDQAGPSQLNNSVDQAGPSQLNERELDNISNDDSSSLPENSSEDVPKFIFPPTDDDGELSKAETSTHSFSMENLEESMPPKAEISTSSLNQSSSSLEAGETEDKTLPGDERDTAAEKTSGNNE